MSNCPFSGLLPIHYTLLIVKVAVILFHILIVWERIMLVLLCVLYQLVGAICNRDIVLVVKLAIWSQIDCTTSLKLIRTAQCLSSWVFPFLFLGTNWGTATGTLVGLAFNQLSTGILCTQQ